MENVQPQPQVPLTTAPLHHEVHSSVPLPTQEQPNKVELTKQERLRELATQINLLEDLPMDEEHKRQARSQLSAKMLDLTMS